MELNHRPLPCQGSALPLSHAPDGRTRGTGRGCQLPRAVPGSRAIDPPLRPGAPSVPIRRPPRSRPRAPSGSAPGELAARSPVFVRSHFEPCAPVYGFPKLSPMRQTHRRRLGGPPDVVSALPPSGIRAPSPRAARRWADRVAGLTTRRSGRVGGARPFSAGRSLSPSRDVVRGSATTFRIASACQRPLRRSPPPGRSRPAPGLRSASPRNLRAIDPLRRCRGRRGCHLGGSHGGVSLRRLCPAFLERIEQRAHPATVP